MPSNSIIDFSQAQRKARLWCAQEKRSNETHASTSDPDARLYRKADGRESRLCFMGHVLMENRNGLAVAAALTHATRTTERETALAPIDRAKRIGASRSAPTRPMT